MDENQLSVSEYDLTQEECADLIDLESRAGWAVLIRCLNESQTSQVTTLLNRSLTTDIKQVAYGQGLIEGCLKCQELLIDAKQALKDRKVSQKQEILLDKNGIVE